MRVSLATQCLDDCVTRVSKSDGYVTAMQLLPGADARIALFLSLWAAGQTQCRHSVRLLSHQSDTWRVTHETPFDTTEKRTWACNGLCISRGLLLCAALYDSNLLVALEVTSDSKSRPAGALQFNSNIRGVCAFASSSEQLVATTHADKTVRLWRHLATATNSGAIALEECCRVVCERELSCIVYADVGLLVANVGGGVQLCGVDGSRIGAPIAQPQLGDADIWCWCHVQDTVVAYDGKSASLLILSTKTQ